MHRILSVILIAAACHQPTNVRLDDIRAHRAVWQSQNLTQYHYSYMLTGYFISFAGKPIRLEVRDGTVQSATIVETGQSIPDAAATFPTIDALFDRAEAAARSHTLKAITFDADLGFPTRMDVAGPPDASGSVFASQVAP